MARTERAGRAPVRLFCAVFSGIALLCPLVARASNDSDAMRYQRCIAQVHDNAQAAMEAALSWIGDGGGAPAKHCLALALLGMGAVSEAATNLENLATARGDYGDDLRAEMLDQAGNAWLLDENGGTAIQDFTVAVNLATKARLPLSAHAQYLTDRARGYLLAKDPKPALKDLNTAIALAPSAQSLTLRARIERQQRDRDRASGDLVKALALDPKYADAFLERGRLRLDEGAINAARQDFLQASLLAKKGPVADAAQNEIAALDIHLPDVKPDPKPASNPAAAKTP